MRYFAVGFLCLVMAGCAGGMSKKECISADWQTIGYEDGSRGAPASAISSRRQACAKKAGVTLDMNAYLAGRSKGLVEYCTPANGYSVGANGQQYHGVCSKNNEKAFLAKYRAGSEYYGYKKRAADAARAVRQAEKRLDAIHHEIAEVEANLVAPKIGVAARIELLAELKHLAEERERIQRSMHGLMIARDREDANLAAYEARTRPRGS